jgi:hypothetical protein
MKSKLLPFIFLLVIAMLSFFSSCRKEDADYREEYLGTYDFTYYYSFTVLGSGTTSYDTIPYVGNVALAGDSSLLVDWPENDQQQELDIELDGSLYKCNTFLGEVNGTTFNIEHDDNVCAPGPNGANYTVQIIGTKQ